MNSNTLELLQPGPSSFSYSTWDLYDYQSLRAFSKRLGDADAEYQGALGRPLCREAFLALNGNAVAGDAAIDQAWARTVAMPKFADLRAAMTDRVSSTIAVMELASLAGNALIQEEARRADKAAQARKRNDPPTDTGEQLPGVVGAPTGLDGDADGDGEGWVLVPGEALDGLQDKVEQTAAFVNAVGASLDGTPGEQLDQTLGLADRVDVSAFHSFLGWAKRIVRGASAEHRAGNEELTGYRPEGWGPRIVSYQMLAVADGEPAALAAFADNALTARTYRSQAPMGKGPVILLRDESGSMGRENLETRHKKALAFELALAQAFNADGRELAVIRWSTRTSEPFVYGAGDVVQHLSSFQSGMGTNPVGAMESAVRFAEDYVPGADILLLTDGAFDNAYATAERLADIAKPFKRDGGRVWGVVVGQSRGDAQASMGEWPDAWVTVDQVEAGKGLGDIVAGMASRDAVGAKTRIV